MLAQKLSNGTTLTGGISLATRSITITQKATPGAPVSPAAMGESQIVIPLEDLKALVAAIRELAKILG